MSYIALFTVIWLGVFINFCNHESFQVKNVPEKLTNIRAALSGLIKRTSHFRRTPATHVFCANGQL